MKNNIAALFLSIILLISCTPKIILKNNNYTTIAIGKFSCLAGTCCWPYLHHKDVKNYHLMVCVHEDISNGGWSSADIFIKSYFLHP